MEQPRDFRDEDEVDSQDRPRSSIDAGVAPVEEDLAALDQPVGDEAGDEPAFVVSYLPDDPQLDGEAARRRQARRWQGVPRLFTEDQAQTLLGMPVIGLRGVAGPPFAKSDLPETPEERRRRNIRNLGLRLEALRMQRDWCEHNDVFRRYLMPKAAGIRPEGDLTEEDRVILLKSLVKAAARKLKTDPHLFKDEDQRLEEIRERHAAGESQRSLAREYGVNQSTISREVRGLR
jgi:hypothetical protein